jgi:iron complex transport system ATP-binding protein
MSPALRLAGAGARIGGRLVLDSVDLTVEAGEMVGVIGPNGAGKTTLLRAALGLLPLAAGTAELGGLDVKTLSETELARRAGYLPQERKAAWNLSAEMVASLGASFKTPGQATEIAREMLAHVGLRGLEARGVLDMSGGERARVLLARLLATRAPLLVADEPAAGLDPDAQLMVLDILRREALQGAAVLVTLHDLTLAARFCDRLVALREGRVRFAGTPAEALSPEGLRDVFGLDGGLLETPYGPVVAMQRRAP